MDENKKKKTTSKTTTKKSTTNKTTSKTSSKKTAVKTPTKKSTTKAPVKKSTTVKKTTTKASKKEDVLDYANGFNDNMLNVNESLNDETKEVIEEINNVKLENSKHTKKEKNKLKYIGVFISIIGVITLIIALVANRIIDREYISDAMITIMLIVSIIIEGFGTFIILSES